MYVTTTGSIVVLRKTLKLKREEDGKETILLSFSLTVSKRDPNLRPLLSYFTSGLFLVRRLFRVCLSTMSSRNC